MLIKVHLIFKIGWLLLLLLLLLLLSLLRHSALIEVQLCHIVSDPQRMTRDLSHSISMTFRARFFDKAKYSILTAVPVIILSIFVIFQTLMNFNT